MAKIQEAIDADYENIFVHQLGPEHKGFLESRKREVMPHFAR